MKIRVSKAAWRIQGVLGMLRILGFNEGEQDLEGEIGRWKLGVRGRIRGK